MRFAASLLLAAFLLGGCGYKGPLYLPTPKPDAKKQAVPPTPTTQPPKVEE